MITTERFYFGKWHAQPETFATMADAEAWHARNGFAASRFTEQRRRGRCFVQLFRHARGVATVEYALLAAGLALSVSIFLGRFHHVFAQIALRLTGAAF